MKEVGLSSDHSEACAVLRYRIMAAATDRRLTPAERGDLVRALAAQAYDPHRSAAMNHHSRHLHAVSVRCAEGERESISLLVQERHNTRHLALIAAVLLAERLEHELLFARDARKEHTRQYKQSNKYSAESSDER
jgi:hypothetical protein